MIEAKISNERGGWHYNNSLQNDEMYFLLFTCSYYTDEKQKYFNATQDPFIFSNLFLSKGREESIHVPNNHSARRLPKAGSGEGECTKRGGERKRPRNTSLFGRMKI